MASPKTTAKPKPAPGKSSAGYEKLASSPSEKQLKQGMVSFSQRLARDPKAARDFLASAGITTSKGNLRKVFGG